MVTTMTGWPPETSRCNEIAKSSAETGAATSTVAQLTVINAARERQDRLDITNLRTPEIAKQV
jgi:hypothetical protein